MLTKDKLYEIIHNPWFLQVVDRHDLERISKDYPYFNILHALIAKKAQLQNFTGFSAYLHKASVYSGNRESLFNLINNISPYTHNTIKSDDMFLIDYADKVPVLATPQPLIAETPFHETDVIQDSENMAPVGHFITEVAPLTSIEDNSIVPQEVYITETMINQEEEIAAQHQLEDEVGDELKHLSIAEHETGDQELEEQNTASDMPVEEQGDIEMSLLPIVDLPYLLHNEHEHSKTPFAEQAMAFVEEHRSELPQSVVTEQGTLVTDDEGDKTYFNLNEKHSFMEWLTFFKAQKDNGTNTATENKTMKTVSQVLKELEQTAPEPISTEITPQPAISQAVKNPEVNADTLAKRSVEDNNKALISETLAQVLLSQGQIEKAIVMYARLSLLNPEKSLYFADLIKDIKTKYNV